MLQDSLLLCSTELLHLEGFTIGAFCFGRVELMCADADAVQCAVLRIGAMVRALLYGTMDTLVCMTFAHHNKHPPFVSVRYYDVHDAVKLYTSCLFLLLF